MQKFKVHTHSGMQDVDLPGTKVRHKIVSVDARNPSEAQRKAIKVMLKKGYTSVSATYPGDWHWRKVVKKRLER